MTPGPDFIRFSVVGGISTISHYLAMITLIHRFEVEPTLASSTGFVLGALINYSLNRRFTFQSDRPHSSAVPRFMTAALSGLALNAGLLAASIYIIGVHYLLAQIVATAVVLFWNYALNKYWTFAKDSSCAPTK